MRIVFKLLLIENYTIIINSFQVIIYFDIMISIPAGGNVLPEGFGYSKDFKLKKEFEQVISKISKLGFEQRILHKYGLPIKADSVARFPQWKSIPLASLNGPFLFVMITWILSSCVFALELVVLQVRNFTQS